MPWYAILDVKGKSRRNDTCKGVVELQEDRTEAVRQALVCAQKWKYALVFSERCGLNGLGGSGNPDNFVIELDKKEGNRAPTLLDTVDFVTGVVENQFNIEEACLVRWKKMRQAGIVRWLEELEKKGSKQQEAWSRVVRDLHEHEWRGLYIALKRVVELLPTD
ncbi:hypothetical protein BDV40DRAFT_296408 [Aspergillus tamarii]|uniref:Uncharacterized protein n=1 Tax=Aspergillus tamarii TaxID=41984 RepID=A0A5N6V739_ASPTM|nr:hypothetical protein BDV40DRAFT_296408 [Aspergillus tamarii]